MHKIFDLKQSILIFILFGFIAATMLAPLASSTFLQNNSNLFNHLAAIMHANFALSQGQFPLRDALINNSGLRYPFFQFNSPISYTFSGIIYYFTPSNPFLAYKITLWIALTLGGIYMFRLGNWFYQSKPIAYLVSVIYLTSPYFLLINNHLFEFNEAIALGVLPIVLFYTFKCYTTEASLRSMLQLSLALFFLLTIHLVTFIYTSLILGILLLLISYKNNNHVIKLLTLCLAYLFACALAMWFIAPIFTTSSFLISHQTTDNLSVFQSHQPPLLGLLSFTANYLMNASKDSIIGITPTIGWPILFAFGICIYALLHPITLIKQTRAQYWLPFLLITFFICFLLTWSPINIWKYFPSPLLMGEYSWRLLSQLSWMGALISGYGICWLFKNNLTHKQAYIGIFLLICVSNSWLVVLDRQLIKIPDDFIRHPGLTSNPDFYLLDTTSHPELINEIDNVTLSTINSPTGLLLNTPYIIPQSLLGYTSHPAILLEGDVKKITTHNELLAIINKQMIAHIPLKPGVLRWIIPINTQLFNNNSPLSFQFALSKKLNDPNEFSLPLKSVILTGFFKPETVLDMTEVQKHCSLETSIVDCKLSIPQQIQTVELPVNYYPNLLDIKLNGKTIPYTSVLRFDHAIAAITPQKGTLNEMTIQFRGLVWANYTSCISWIIFLILSLCVLVQRIIPVNIWRTHRNKPLFEID